MAAAGLVLDIAGALLLAMGLMFKKPQHAIGETTPRWDFNLDLDASLARQTADAQVGGLLLTLGFAIQMVAALGWHRTSSWSAVTYATVLAFALDLVCVVSLFRVWRPRHLRRMAVTRLATSDEGSWWPILAYYGPLLGEPPNRHLADQETLADYGKRVLEWRWDRLVEGRQLQDITTKLRRDRPGTVEYEQAHPQPTDAPRST